MGVRDGGGHCSSMKRPRLDLSDLTPATRRKLQQLMALNSCLLLLLLVLLGYCLMKECSREEKEVHR